MKWFTRLVTKTKWTASFSALCIWFLVYVHVLASIYLPDDSGSSWIFSFSLFAEVDTAGCIGTTWTIKDKSAIANNTAVLLSRDYLWSAACTKTAASKKHPANILLEEEHIRGIILCNQSQIYCLKQLNCYQLPNTEFQKKKLSKN